MTVSIGSRWTGRYRAVLVVVLVAFAGCAGGGLQSGDGDAGQPSGGSAGDGAGVGSYYTDSGERVLVREADMRLRVDNFSRALVRLRAVARGHGGYVGDRSQRSEGQWDAGHVTVRVPAGNFSAARDDVAAVGNLESEDVRVLDFTSEFENRERRIRQLERDERELERLLANATDTDQALQVRNELEQVRERIRDLERQQSSLRQREAMSTIRIDLHEPEQRKPPRNFESSFGFVDAFLGAFYGGLTAVKYVIVFFGYAIPVGLALLALGAFGSVLYLAWRRTFYRIRSGFERALGAPAGQAGGTGNADEGPSGDGDGAATDDGATE